MSAPWDRVRSAGPLLWRLGLVAGLAGAVALLLAGPLPAPEPPPGDRAAPGTVAAAPGSDRAAPGTAPGVAPRGAVGVAREADAGADPGGPRPEPSATADLMARPVFAPSRRPWIAPLRPDQPAPAAGSLADHILVGVMLSGGDSQALVRGPGGRTVSLREGERLEGWVLERITDRGLRFLADGASYDMVFRPRSETGQ